MNKPFRIISTIVTLIFLTSCNENEDGGTSFKLWMMILGFPLMGIAMGLGNFLLKTTGIKDKKDNDPFTVQTFIVGGIVLLIIYLLIFKT
ncbi:MAG: hypothetical protein JST23_02635 [Bacteroidetes bacterium]|nr:hypothetical protein [Bacteroidota bacterium]